MGFGFVGFDIQCLEPMRFQQTPKEVKERVMQIHKWEGVQVLRATGARVEGQKCTQSTRETHRGQYVRRGMSRESGRR